MTEPGLEDDFETTMSAIVEPSSDEMPDVEFAMPPSAYSTIVTDENLAPEIVTIPPKSHPSQVGLSPVIQAVEALGVKLDALATAFDREIRAESTREKIVDRLHAELQEYKQDLVLSLMKPVYLDLIQLHDDVGKMAAASAIDQNGWMANVRQGIEDILYRQGVEPFTTDLDDFDARKQRAITTVPTEDSALNRKVASRMRPGFAAGDRVIRPEVVSVYALRRI